MGQWVFVNDMMSGEWMEGFKIRDYKAGRECCMCDDGEVRVLLMAWRGSIKRE